MTRPKCQNMLRWSGQNANQKFGADKIKYQIYCTQIKIHLSGCLNSPSWAVVLRQRAANLVLVAKKPLQSREPPDLSRPLSLDQGHIEIVPQLMVHVCPELSNPKPRAASTSWNFPLMVHVCSLNLHRPELHQCYPWSLPFETCWTPSILVSCSEITTESVLSCLPPDVPFLDDDGAGCFLDIEIIISYKFTTLLKWLARRDPWIPNPWSTLWGFMTWCQILCTMRLQCVSKILTPRRMLQKTWLIA